MSLQALRSQLRGAVITRADPGYDNSRRSLAWNAYVQAASPTAIVPVASDRDVVAAVTYARRHNLRVAISGGGHGLCSALPADNALLLDLSQLDSVSIDVAARRASVGPVVRNRDFARQLQAHGLAFPYGHCSTVALSGYMLSGGFGWNSGQWGPACFNLEAVDAVLADGTLVTATEDQHSDILWAARGGGAGFFAVATRYQIRLHPYPRCILTSTWTFPIDCAAEIGRWLFERSAQFPSNLEVMLALTSTGNVKVCRLTAAAFADDERDARAALAPLDDCPLQDRCYERRLCEVGSFDTLFDGMDQMFPAQHRYLAHSIGSDRTPDELLAAVVPHLKAAPSAQCLILCPILPPPPADAAQPPPSAFSLAPRTFFMAYAVWNDAYADNAHRAWHQAVVDTLEPVTSCYYVGETNVASYPERAPRCFSAENWQRLQMLRNRYDPNGVFRTFVFP